MSSKHVIIAILLITAGIAVVGSFEGEVEADTTFSTLNVGSGKTYSTIQSAIDAASSGDNIKIYVGTYNENVIVDKTLVIIGEGADSTIIDAGGSGSAMIVEEDDCRIEGLGFTGSGGEEPEVYFNSGLTTKANNTLIQNCTFYDNYMGALLRGGDHFKNNKMVYCEAYENDVHGIGIGRYSVIQACYSHDNEGSGFWAFVTPGSLLERCRAEDNGYMGFQFDYTEVTEVLYFIARNNAGPGIGIGGGSCGFDNWIDSCLIETNGDGGISINNVEGPMSILNNTIRENTGSGINFTHGNCGDNIRILGNSIENNTNYGIEVTTDSNDQTILVCRNDLINNRNGQTQAYDANSQNEWDVQGYTINWNDWTTTLPSYGNYWNEWTTPDADSDGIVDNPYALDGGVSQKDNYPLTNRISSSTAHLLPNDLWDSGKYFVNLDGTIGHPSGEGDYPDYGGGSPPSGDDDDDDDIDPPADDDDTLPPPDDDDDSQQDDYNITGTPEIEFQDDEYNEGEDQELKVPDDFAADNDDLEYDWYVEGYGYLGTGESIDLDLPEGTYEVQLVGRDLEGNEVFVITKELYIGPSEEKSTFMDKIRENMFILIIATVILLLFLVTFAFVLGKRRREKKEEIEKSPRPQGPQPHRVVRPGPVGPSMSGSDQVFSGILEVSLREKISLDHDGIQEITEANGNELDYNRMKVLSETVEISKEKLGKVNSNESVRSKLEMKFKEGALDKSEFDELNEVLNRYMK